WQPFAFDASEVDPRLRLTSLAGNPADFAAFLVLPLLIAQTRIWERSGRGPGPRAGRRGSTAAWWWVGSALCLYATILTATLTALAALVLGTLAVWWALLDRK